MFAQSFRNGLDHYRRFGVKREFKPVSIGVRIESTSDEAREFDVATLLVGKLNFIVNDSRTLDYRHPERCNAWRQWHRM